MDHAELSKIFGLALYDKGAFGDKGELTLIAPCEGSIPDSLGRVRFVALWHDLSAPNWIGGSVYNADPDAFTARVDAPRNHPYREWKPRTLKRSMCYPPQVWHPHSWYVKPWPKVTYKDPSEGKRIAAEYYDTVITFEQVDE